MRRLATSRPPDDTQVRARTQKLAAFDQLARFIVELDLPPGTRLIETDLAARLNVSKTPIREALLLLEGENLVEIRPYQGASVSWLTLDEYHEIHFLLDALEIPALPTVIERISDLDIEATRRLVRRAVRARKAEDSERFGELTTQVHERLFGVARSMRMTRFIGGLVARPGRRYARVFQHQFPDVWDVELELIVGRFEGIARRDAAAAARAMSEGHARLFELASQRIDHPVVKPYVQVPDAHADVPVIPMRRTRRSASSVRVGALE